MIPVSFQDFIYRSDRIDDYRLKINNRLLLCSSYSEESLIRLNEIFQLSLLLEYLSFFGSQVERYETLLKNVFIEFQSKQIISIKCNNLNFHKINQLSDSLERTINYWTKLTIKDFFIGTVYSDMLWMYLSDNSLQRTIQDCIKEISENNSIDLIPDLVDIKAILKKQSNP